MIILTEQQRNEKRFDGLSKYSKNLVNDFALAEFNKPLKYRVRAVSILDFVEYDL